MLLFNVYCLFFPLFIVACPWRTAVLSYHQHSARNGVREPLQLVFVIPDDMIVTNIICIMIVINVICIMIPEFIHMKEYFFMDIIYCPLNTDDSLRTKVTSAFNRKYQGLLETISQ